MITLSMVIIAIFIGLITQNFIIGKTNLYISRFGCKNCGYEGRLHRHGTYPRNVITFFQVFRINVQRFKCPMCKKTYSILPSFLIPYFQYSFDFIMSTLYMAYVLSISPSNVSTIINDIGTHYYISLQSILFYMKRFSIHRFDINSFFAPHDRFHYDADIRGLDDVVAAGILLKKIFLYNTISGSFNSDYQNISRRHFMSP